MARGRAQLTIEGARRRAEIVRLRTQRVEWDTIAARYDISASRAVAIYRAAIAAAPNAAVDEHREELGRLANLALTNLVAIALDDNTSDRSKIESWSVAARWHERLSRLYGVDQTPADTLDGPPLDLHQIVVARINAMQLQRTLTVEGTAS